jgi:DNA-binding protein HU-beta
MTKADFVAELAETGKITKRQAETVFSTFVESIVDTLRRGQRVAVPGLGSFSCVKRAARKGRNPRTGQEIKVPARTAVKFSVSSTLSQSVNGKKRAAKKAAAKPAKKKK